MYTRMKQFNNIEPTIEPTATGHIVEQIVMIEKIIADEYAYTVNGSVYSSSFIRDNVPLLSTNLLFLKRMS